MMLWLRSYGVRFELNSNSSRSQHFFEMEIPLTRNIPCVKLVWRWSKDGLNVPCVTTRPHSLMQKNVGVWYFHFKKVLWSTRVTIELLRPESKHHDEPIELPFKSVRSCVICGKPTKWHCWGCTEDIGGIFPVCPTSVRPCNAELHRTRREI